MHNELTVADGTSLISDRASPLSTSLDLLSDKEVEDILHAIWDCEMEVRYWNCLSRFIDKLDRSLKMVTVIGLAGTAGLFSEIVHSAEIWQKSSAVIAGLGLLVQFTDYPKDAYEMTLLSGEWGDLQCEYESIKHEIPYRTRRESLSSYLELRKQQAKLEQKAVRLPSYEWLYSRCQKAVCKAHPLII